MPLRGLASRPYIEYETDSESVLTITSPLSGALVLTSAFTITWMVLGTQRIYQVQIYSDAAGTTVVYDTGEVSSAVQSHNVPAGSILSGETYYLRVFSWLDDGSAAESVVQPFSTAFPVIGLNISGLSVANIGGCEGDRTALPGFRITWNVAVPGVGETFVSYEVRRREAGETAYSRIATLTVQGSAGGTKSYSDYNVRSGTTYQYVVVWNSSHATGTLTSAEQVPPGQGYLRFEFCFIHEAATPAQFVRFESHQANVEPVLDAAISETWGRPLPTVFYGEKFAHTIRISGLELLRRDLLRWPALRTLFYRQITTGSVLCVRLGRDRERYFANALTLPKDVGQMTFTPEITLQEVTYTEDVTVEA